MNCFRPANLETYSYWGEKPGYETIKHSFARAPIGCYGNPRPCERYTTPLCGEKRTQWAAGIRCCPLPLPVR